MGSPWFDSTQQKKVLNPDNPSAAFPTDTNTDPFANAAQGAASLLSAPSSTGTTATAPATIPTNGGSTGGYWPASTITPQQVGSPQNADITTPQGQLATVAGWLQAGGFGGDDPNYWVGKINSTGGFTPQNLQYWQARIAAGPQGGQPGGQYYDAAAGGNSLSDPIDATTRQALIDAMTRDSQPVSINDPALAGQAQAYATSQQRSSDQMRSALAERLAAEGLNSGGQGSGTFDTGVQGIQEQQGQNISGYNANLVGNEVQNRRQDLQNQLQIANSFGARNEASQIQLALATLDNQYRYATLNQNQGQFQDQTAFNYAQLQQQLQRDALLAGLGQG